MGEKESKTKFKQKIMNKDTGKVNLEVLLPIIIVAVLVIVAIVICVGKLTAKIKPEDQYEKIVNQKGSCIQYSFDFSDVNDYKKEYKIKNNKIAFEITNDGMSSFSYNGKDKIETIAKKFDVYYLKKEDAAVIVVNNELFTDMYFADNKEIKNLSEIVKGAVGFKNISLKDKVLSFDVERWKRTEYSDYTDYLVLTDSEMFSAYADDYTQYVADDYAVEATYKYKLSDRDFKLDKFEIVTTKTMKQLADEISNLGENQEQQIEE